MPTFSAVIPAHNEATNLPELIDDLHSALDYLGEPYEIIVVDDGSTDGTAAVVGSLGGPEGVVRLLSLDGNYGQSAAFDAGFRAARGDVIITLDADGQNPPHEIPRLLAALGEYDMVCGWRRGRKDHWTKRWASKFANTVRRTVLQDGVHDTGCSLKAFRREVVERLKFFHGMHRFLPALAQMEGFAITEVRVAHRPRTRGESHYGVVNRMFGPLVDLLVVCWMKRRCRRWKLAETPAGNPVRGGVLRGPTPRRHAPSTVGASEFGVALPPART